MKALVDAFTLAASRHDGQCKRGTRIPFIYHPMAVASLVLQYGGDEAQGIAALLHDAVADGRTTRTEIEARFGKDAALIAFAFSDPDFPPGKEPTWREVREAYLHKLAHFDDRVLLVTAAEELHDGRELVHDLRHAGQTTWDRYPVPPADVLWYYESLLKLFERKLHASRAPLANEFRGMVGELRALV